MIMSNWNRVQIFVLIFIGFLVFIRLFSDPPSPRGAITLSDLDVYELHKQAFQISEPLKVVIDAVGSIDERQEATGLAAYSWITLAHTGEVVWSMNAANTRQDESIVYVEEEELELDSGSYILYFASYGQLQRRSNLTFRKDRRKWHVTIHAPDNKTALRKITRPLEGTSDRETWDAISLRREEKREIIIEVHRSAELEIHAIGQLGRHNEVQPVDYSRIEDAVSGRIIWQLSRDNTDWAGGIQENRMFKGQLVLPPSVYRAVAVTNSSHHYGSWKGNPPFHPEGWGLQIRTSDVDDVSTFDPWMQRNAIIEFTGVGDDEYHVQSFTVEDTAAVVIYALGEITGPDNGYDLAWLDRQESAGESVTIWEMSYEGSVPAGGHRKNRKEIEFIRLNPGVYRLYYESDGSHAYDDWNSAEPDYPERWGVGMFPVKNQETAITVGISSEDS